MKRLASITTGLCLALALCIGLSLGMARSAAAQSLNANCSMLSGSPFMCLKNLSGKMLVAVQAVPPGGGWFNPAAWISIPGGGVTPGGLAVVKFPAYSRGCIQTVVVRSDDGSPHYFWNINVCTSTSLEIRW